MPEGSEIVRKELYNRAQVGPEPHEPTDATCIFLQFNADAFDVFQHPPRISQNGFSGGGQRHSICATIKQLSFDRIFQVGEPLAHSRWSDCLPLCCSRESSFLANGHEQLQRKNVEIAQGAPIHHFLLCRSSYRTGASFRWASEKREN